MSDTVSDTKSPPETAQADLTAAAEAFEGPQKGAAAVSEVIGERIAGYSYVAPPAPGSDVHGLWHYFPCHDRSGYAAHAIAMHAMMQDRLKVPVSLVPTRSAAIDIDYFPRDRFDMLLRWNKDTCGHPEAMIVSLPPSRESFREWDRTRAFVMYCAYEATAVSEFAVQICNDDRVTALWCVSPFTARAFIDSGVEPGKVFVLPPPICDGPWLDMLDDTGPASEPEGIFRFTTMGTWHERKGFHDLIRAYFSTFKREEPVELAIRTSSLGDGDTLRKFKERVIDEIASIARAYGDARYPHSMKMPRIRMLLGTDLTDREVMSWLCKFSDCFVNASYGEGLGIPAMWAAAHGIPIVSSDFGAVGEFLADAQVAAPVGDVLHMFPAKVAPVPTTMLRFNSLFDPNAQWGSYDVPELGAAMRRAFSAGRRRNDALARYTRSRFSYDRCEHPAAVALKFISRPETLARWGL